MPRPRHQDDLETNQLPLSTICADPLAQARVGLDAPTIDDYRTQMAAGVLFPALTVFHDGKSFWLADSLHCFTAAQSAGLEVVECAIRKGGLREAILFSVGANYCDRYGNISEMDTSRIGGGDDRLAEMIED